MKLATVTHDSSEQTALVIDDGKRLVMLSRAYQALTGQKSATLATMQGIIDGQGSARQELDRIAEARPEEAIVDASEVQWQAPLPRPVQIRDFGCFMDHFRNARARIQEIAVEEVELPAIQLERPLYYVANRLTVAGHGAVVRWPRYSTLRDYELEFACVLGRGGMDIAREDAETHVFGYTIFNDFSARDTQLEEISTGLGLSKSKDFDNSNVLGPWIVTSDEIGDPYKLQMVARINGEEVSRGTTADMDHTFADVIAFASTSTPLEAGEVLCSGTVPTGCGMEHGRFLEPGDIVELEVTGLGILRNQVVA
ncbi:fumarylacetoacetate hydrolase family protein [Rhodococcus sp. MSC1_016]|jgi:2-keto-4-pentenoate hydratase/2-oxohepta-3-ene-1,7-dioic acid hydratase in catechol pathway|uniref:fumarylacetoacetate hydrolase family protein n=1 Tax=Rhodococcus sp. MSC1_016 TaxID=2909266 RepID=UPI00202E35C3|nr:fumarylacetoacetate hydrolase family protein [Rhodococcus sp. MSC1_016]